jgi:hypothetical protein
MAEAREAVCIDTAEAKATSLQTVGEIIEALLQSSVMM